MARLVLKVHLLPARLDRPMRGGRGPRMNEARGPPAGEHRPTRCPRPAKPTQEVVILPLRLERSLSSRMNALKLGINALEEPIRHVRTIGF
ncbi:uncharacterized protein SCHCODRAFT_02082123 [Schizophyllum commune H4-8]|uniref:uncharacterized protein n=1 Tax=Schizophyllum commune (strain H4-8 / FGSC 9210) TaxID=578458 RepID=UPI0021601470|nr:uncharacterized protein SCHCODRAFT_02082123 [Schizophyllum commune H4-8]KAI5886826.1 hypothetical protein SCHCODRAFT_02082123 [Schizophyllum commune H4-8]